MPLLSGRTFKNFENWRHTISILPYSFVQILVVFAAAAAAADDDDDYDDDATNEYDNRMHILDCVYADNTTVIVATSVVGAVILIAIIVLFHFVR